MKLKKTLCIITIGLLLTPICHAITVYAANTADSPYQFALTTSYTSPIYTSYRQKQDPSSSYVYPTSLSGVTKVSVSIRGKNDNGMYDDVTAAHYYYTTTRAYRVDNYVWENGYEYASLGGKSLSGNGTTSGVWSPDCANQSAYPQMPH